MPLNGNTSNATFRFLLWPYPPYTFECGLAKYKMNMDRSRSDFIRTCALPGQNLEILELLKYKLSHVKFEPVIADDYVDTATALAFIKNGTVDCLMGAPYDVTRASTPGAGPVAVTPPVALEYASFLVCDLRRKSSSLLDQVQRRMLHPYGGGAWLLILLCFAAFVAGMYYISAHPSRLWSALRHVLPHSSKPPVTGNRSNGARLFAFTVAFSFFLFTSMYQKMLMANYFAPPEKSRQGTPELITQGIESKQFRLVTDDVDYTLIRHIKESNASLFAEVRRALAHNPLRVYPGLGAALGAVVTDDGVYPTTGVEGALYTMAMSQYCEATAIEVPSYTAMLALACRKDYALLGAMSGVISRNTPYLMGLQTRYQRQLFAGGPALKHQVRRWLADPQLEGKRRCDAHYCKLTMYYMNGLHLLWAAGAIAGVAALLVEVVAKCGLRRMRAA